MKLFATLVFAFIVVGCAGPVTQWRSANTPLAEQGKLKWSEYYRQLYDVALKANFSGKGAFLKRVDKMIAVSLMHESGKMPKEDFDRFVRLDKAAEAEEEEEHKARVMGAWATSMQRPAPVYQPPVQTMCNTYGAMTNCTSQ